MNLRPPLIPELTFDHELITLELLYAIRTKLAHEYTKRHGHLYLNIKVTHQNSVTNRKLPRKTFNLLPPKI